jgi:hypothetical protein
VQGLHRRTFLMLAVASGGSLVIGFRGAGAGPRIRRLPIGDQLRPGKAPTRQDFS